MTSSNEHMARLRRGVVPDSIPEPRKVPFDAPWSWLGAAWRDIGQAPVLSFMFGLGFTVAAALVLFSLASLSMLSVALPLAGGSLLVGPLLAVGLYQISRRLAQGQTPSPADVFTAGSGTRSQLAFFGAVLMVVFFIWLRLAFLLLMLFLGTSAVPPASQFMHALLFTPAGLGLLVVGTCVGGILAAAVFCISALSIPMLLDRRVDALSAARASIAGIMANKKAMGLWAVLIAALVAIGFATLLIGFVVIFPLVGYATWHAYAAVYGNTPEV